MFFSTKNGHGHGHGHEHDPFLKHQDFHLPISFFPFPSPFEVDEFHGEPHNFPPAYNPEIIHNNSTTTPMAISNNSDEQKIKKKAPRKRLCKKDRHSKICTARGQRDRRMRLSLPVARQFFGLQDMLGVDKGSKTVEWLLVQARPQILKLAKERNYSLAPTLDRAKSVSSSNSEIDEVGGAGDEKKLVAKKMKSGGKEMKKRIKKPISRTMAKEMREKARERARARTMEKNHQLQIRDYSVISDFDHHDPNYTTNFTKIASSCFETGEESGATTQISYNFNPPALELEDQPISSQFGSDYQNSLEIMGNWSPCASTFNFLHHTSALDLQEEHEFGDSQFFG